MTNQVLHPFVSPLGQVPVPDPTPCELVTGDLFAITFPSVNHLFLLVITSAVSNPCHMSFLKVVSSHHCALKPFQFIFPIECCQQGECQQRRSLA